MLRLLHQTCRGKYWLPQFTAQAVTPPFKRYFISPKLLKCFWILRHRLYVNLSQLKEMFVVYLTHIEEPSPLMVSN